VPEPPLPPCRSPVRPLLPHRRPAHRLAGKRGGRDAPQKAIELYQQQDYDGVAKLLDQIRRSIRNTPYLWFTYGEMAVMHGQFFEAIRRPKERDQLHPESLAAIVYSLNYRRAEV